MQKSNAEILHHFYSLLLEINFKDAEMPTAAEVDDPFIQKHLRQIRLKMSKNRAALQKGTYRNILDELDRLRKIGIEELRKFINPIQAQQLQPLFSKFESLTLDEKKSIEEDQELLLLITNLKDKLDDTATGES